MTSAARKLAPEAFAEAAGNFFLPNRDRPFRYGFQSNDGQRLPQPYAAHLGAQMVKGIADGRALEFCRSATGNGWGGESDLDTVRRLRMVIGFAEFLLHSGGVEVR